MGDRLAICLALAAFATSASAQSDIWVIDRVLPDGTRIPGYWTPGSNAYAYDNFTWRLGDPYFNAYPHNIPLIAGWSHESFARGYDPEVYDNPYYESEEINLSIAETHAVGRLEPTDPTLDFGEHYDAYTFYEDEADWITVEVESDDFDPYLIVVDTGGTYWESDNFGDLNSRVDFPIPREATTLIVVTSAVPGATGLYRLTTQRNVGSIQPSQIELALQRRARLFDRELEREERRAMERAQPAPRTLPPSGPPPPEFTRTGDHTWTDDEGGSYMIQPSL